MKLITNINFSHPNNINVRIFPAIHKKIALPEPSVPHLLFSSNIKFKTTFKNCVLEGLSQREWKQTYDDDWNVMWCEK